MRVARGRVDCQSTALRSDQGKVPRSARKSTDSRLYQQPTLPSHRLVTPRLALTPARADGARPAAADRWRDGSPVTPSCVRGGFHCLDADAEVGGDFLVALALADAAQDLALARRQCGDAGGFSRPSIGASILAEICGLRNTWPACAARSASSSSCGAASLTTNPTAPRSRASRTCAASSCMVIITTRVPGARSRISLSASRPVRPGNDRSIRTTSGACCRASCSACSALLASATSCTSANPCSSRARPARTRV